MAERSRTQCSSETPSMGEIMRVLVPNGVAYVKTGAAWKKTVKPYPTDIDDWSQAPPASGTVAYALHPRMFKGWDL